ncbi:GntR family transcriptional regulator [Prauserella cavernicola]|uniref:GntR family transcriptional regulator n=1 Tax=Prauserella cavernicola TaxID=2800127 RepID=A0A934QP60_9PSEU|nr:GntR family transcriptional regulator [Prauserella cavernicola]MBK1783825.1 GntR family transcriptional regulator [Prauserella cavernicola]
MPLRIVVDTESGLAPWRQVQDQIVRAISIGALTEGTRLPPIRQLSRDLGLASGTVARAYRELEAAGWVATARARGTFVTAPTGRPDPGELLREAAEEFAARARELGADPDTATALVREHWADRDSR